MRTRTSLIIPRKRLWQLRPCRQTGALLCVFYCSFFVFWRYQHIDMIMQMENIAVGTTSVDRLTDTDDPPLHQKITTMTITITSAPRGPTITIICSFTKRHYYGRQICNLFVFKLSPFVLRSAVRPLTLQHFNTRSHRTDSFLIRLFSCTAVSLVFLTCCTLSWKVVVYGQLDNY